jgi:inosine-uridine nucleoside N-ribohydrolase
MNTVQKQPIIIDTDPGHDDALAILLLEKSERFDIRAVTTVAGNGSVQDTTNNARYILDLIGSRTPLYSGADKPLKRELIKAVVHGEGGMAGAQIAIQEKLSGNAADKIIEIVRADPRHVAIVMIGPETNLAAAFLKDPALPSLIKEIVIMGGAIEVPGNKNCVGEFNIFVDPDAADVVFRANVKKTLVPLDVCNNIFLNLEDFETLKGSKLYEPIMDMMRPYIKGIQQFEKFSGALMYDPLAAYYLLNPSAYKTVPMDIAIETESDLTRGMTVADRRNWGDKRPNVDVIVSVDRAAFVNDLLNTLRK